MKLLLLLSRTRRHGRPRLHCFVCGCGRRSRRSVVLPSHLHLENLVAGNIFKSIRPLNLAGNLLDAPPPPATHTVPTNLDVFSDDK